MRVRIPRTFLPIVSALFLLNACGSAKRDYVNPKVDDPSTQPSAFLNCDHHERNTLTGKKFPMILRVDGITYIEGFGTRFECPHPFVIKAGIHCLEFIIDKGNFNLGGHRYSGLSIPLNAQKNNEYKLLYRGRSLFEEDGLWVYSEAGDLLARRPFPSVWIDDSGSYQAGISEEFIRKCAPRAG